MLISIFWVFMNYLVIGGIWVLLEKIVYGQITPRILDDIVCIALAISLYFNFK